MDLPVELMLSIASTPETFRQLLALPIFARYVRENRAYVLNKFTKIVKNDEYTIYYLGGKIHREDGPAVEYKSGAVAWFQYGKLYRGGDLPAIVYSNGSKYWCNGHKIYHEGYLPDIENAVWSWSAALHRDGDLPAIVYNDGGKHYHKYGKRHRDNDLPAIECADGTKCWCWDDKLHRDGGRPAVEYPNGTKEWWVNGVNIM